MSRDLKLVVNDVRQADVNRRETVAAAVFTRLSVRLNALCTSESAARDAHGRPATSAASSMPARSFSISPGRARSGFRSTIETRACGMPDTRATSASATRWRRRSRRISEGGKTRAVRGAACMPRQNRTRSHGLSSATLRTFFPLQGCHPARPRSGPEPRGATFPRSTGPEEVSRSL